MKEQYTSDREYPIKVEAKTSKGKTKVNVEVDDRNQTLIVDSVSKEEIIKTTARITELTLLEVETHIQFEGIEAENKKKHSKIIELKKIPGFTHICKEGINGNLADKIEDDKQLQEEGFIESPTPEMVSSWYNSIDYPFDEEPTSTPIMTIPKGIKDLCRILEIYTMNGHGDFITYRPTRPEEDDLQKIEVLQKKKRNF